MEKKDKFDSS